MAAEDDKRSWIQVQKRTFTRWSNNYLADRILKIEDMEKDLGDGIFLINLLEIISAKVIGRYNKKPTIKPQKLENLLTALNFVKSQGIRLVGIGAEDIYDGNLKLILGLIWTLILRFHIQRGNSEGSPKAELLEWVRSRVEPYGLKPKNFNMDWTDGRVLSALTDSLKPGVLDFKSLTHDPVTDTEKAMEVAANEYNIPRLVDVADMVECPEELSVMTYVSYFRDWLNDDSRRRAAEIEAERLFKLGTADPSKCYAHGRGVETGATNNDCPFEIQSVNYFGDALSTGGDKYIAQIEGPENLQIQIVDNDNGSYSCNYKPTLPGDFKISIKLRDHEIKNSPYGPILIRGPDSTTTTVSGPGVEGARVKTNAPFIICAKDKNGNQCPHGGDPFSVSVSGPNGSPIEVTLHDNGDGSYSGNYTPIEPGVYNVQVLLKDEPINGSPFKPLIEQGSAAKSFAEGDGLTHGKTDHPCHIRVHAVDPDGNRITNGGDPFKILITDANDQSKQPIIPNITDNHNGTYDIVYTVDQPGDYKIDIDLHNQPIQNSPFHPHIKPSADADNCYALGRGISDDLVDNEPANFVIHAVDKSGKPRTDGGDPFVVKIDGPIEVIPNVIDNNDGTYTVTYNPDVPGDYKIDVELEGQPIKGAPYTAKVVAGTESELSGFSTFSIVVQSRDKHRANKSFGGDNFQVNIQGPTAVEVATSDNNNGTYTARYSLEQNGLYVVNLTLNGKHIAGSPLKQEF
eukprot:TRINITY_DN1968_c0_g1_i1.p1 TRINITY_DN1968_c0_g1~~TRINITY_DN1968_c0_g1_i1.p1  ORF type:complete len:741 (+),score=451.97 TRINITY_DN1968_c0_g1_i1:146-2368(+)